MSINKEYRFNCGTKNGVLTNYFPNSAKSLSVLSMNLYNIDEYPSDISDFGCVIGRVQSNGVGIPNAKVSIFIPLTEEDRNDPFISNIYPFNNVKDKDGNGNRYNLLPKYKYNPKENIFFNNNPYEEGYGGNVYGVGYKPDTPIGSFFSQEEVIGNEKVGEVYEKYYKYSTISNESGDFCIFGVPVGDYVLHMDADLTDIGKFSTKPIILSKILGYPETLFENNGTRIKENTTLENAKHIISQDIPITVTPFWGNKTVNSVEIGMTRQDFELNIDLKPTTTIFTSTMTMAKNAYWYDFVVFRLIFGIGIRIKIPIVGKITLPFIYISGDFGSNVCTVNGGAKSLEPFEFQFRGLNNPIDLRDAFKFDLDTSFFNGEDSDKIFLSTHRGGIPNFNVIDHKESDSPIVMNESQYAEIKDEGVWSAIIPCNTKKKITDESGNLVDVPDDYDGGVFTEFKGSLYCSVDAPLDNPNTKVSTERLKLKVPQSIDYQTNINEWIETHEIFEFNKFYSVSQKYYSALGDAQDFDNIGSINNLEDKDIDGQINDKYGDFKIDYPSPVNGYEWFSNKTVNMCLYFLQIGYKPKGGARAFCDNVVNGEDVRFNSNTIANGLVGTQFLSKGSAFKTSFIEVARKDIYNILNNCKKSDFNYSFYSDLYDPDSDLTIAPNKNGKNIIYFKGVNGNDVIKFLYDKKYIIIKGFKTFDYNLYIQTIKSII